MEKRVRYEIREIDEWGDAIDVVEEFEGRGAKARAVREMESRELLHEEAVGAILERAVYTGCESEGVVDIDYSFVSAAGDREAMTRLGWTS